MKNIYLILVFFLTISASAQRSTTTFIEPLDSSKVNFKVNQQRKYNAMMSNDMYKKVSLVRIGNLAAIQRRGFLPMNIPGMDK